MKNNIWTNQVPLGVKLKFQVLLFLKICETFFEVFEISDQLENKLTR